GRETRTLLEARAGSSVPAFSHAYRPASNGVKLSRRLWTRLRGPAAVRSSRRRTRATLKHAGRVAARDASEDFERVPADDVMLAPHDGERLLHLDRALARTGDRARQARGGARLRGRVL